MKKNVGKIDAIFRVVIGLAICAAGFYYKSWWGLLGLVPLTTAALGSCPLYQILGCTTCAGGSCDTGPKQ